MLILFPMLSAFCRYLTWAFKGLVAPARAVIDTHTQTHTQTHRLTAGNDSRLSVENLSKVTNQIDVIY